MAGVAAKAPVEHPAAAPCRRASQAGTQDGETRSGPLALWLGGLLVGTWLFHALGDGRLAAPPLEPAGWAGWMAERDAFDASIALLRLVVLALSWYLVGATTIGLIARLARAARLVRVVDTLTVPFVRRLLQTTLGVSLATTMVVSAVPAGTLPPLVDARSTARVGATQDLVGVASVPLIRAAASSQGGTYVAAGDQLASTTRAPVVPARRPVPLELLDRAHHGARTSDGGHLPAGGGGHVGRHVVVTGDSLWSIAEVTLADATGERPADRTISRYWRDVVAANRDALSDPRNPDLIFPGEVVRLPALPT